MKLGDEERGYHSLEMCWSCGKDTVTFLFCLLSRVKQASRSDKQSGSAASSPGATVHKGASTRQTCRSSYPRRVNPALLKPNEEITETVRFLARMKWISPLQLLLHVFSFQLAEVLCQVLGVAVARWLLSGDNFPEMKRSVSCGLGKKSAAARWDLKVTTAALLTGRECKMNLQFIQRTNLQ